MASRNIVFPAHVPQPGRVDPVGARAAYALIDTETMTIKSVGTSEPQLLPYQVMTYNDDEHKLAVRELTRHYTSPEDLKINPDTHDVIEIFSGDIVSVSQSELQRRLDDQHAAELEEAERVNSILREQVERLSLAVDYSTARADQAVGNFEALRTNHDALVIENERLKLELQVAKDQPVNPFTPDQIEMLKSILAKQQA